MRTLPCILLCGLLPALSSCTQPEAMGIARFDPKVTPSLRVRDGGFGKVHVWADVDDELAGWFLLDTGADTNLLDKSAAEQLGLELTHAGNVGGVGASVKAFSARADTLQVGPLTMNSPRFLVADVEVEGKGDLLGTLGSDMFKHSVVVYDLEQPAAAIYDPATYEPPPIEWEDCVLLKNRPFAKMQVEQQEVLLEIDTGGGEAVLLCAPAVERLGLKDGRTSRDSLIYGPFGSAPVRKVTLDSFEVGTLRFDGLSGTLGVDSDGWLGSTVHDGLIGAPILRHMVLVFDYGNERISFTDRRLFRLLEGAELDGNDGVDSVVHSESQATGEPDTVNRSSYRNAWFPPDSDGKHWLELTYDAPIQPVRVAVWGTGAQRGLTALHGITASGVEFAIDWVGELEESLNDGLGLTASTVEVGEPVLKIRIDVDCSRVEGTNVIDAVGLVDASGKTHWAREARASGRLQGVERPRFDESDALKRHAARLKQRGQVSDAERVRQRIETMRP